MIIFNNLNCNILIITFTTIFTILTFVAILSYNFINLEPILRIWNKFLNLCAINKIKILLLLFIFTYTVLLAIVIYFLFKAHKTNVAMFRAHNIIQVQTSIFNILSEQANINLEALQFKYYNPDLIKACYSINGFSHYTEFIYSNSADMRTLHAILESNPPVNTNFRAMIIQDMIGSHEEVLTDITKQFMRSIFKYSSPLLAAGVVFSCITLFETIGPLYT